ncbi:uncharacterized protein LOC143046565 [Mytilus galloprovincialis]|uniref:uncharacterized protein LOC143046565 n=1 Tax=Mytilus galloprovincialis TaxID=29158 RepID=UPI003F7BBFCF
MTVQVTRLSSSVRSIIVNLHKEKLSSVQIQRELERRHQTKTTRQSIRLFLIRYKKNGLIGQNSKRIISKKRVLDIHRQAINIWLTENSELTSKALCEKLDDIFQLQVTTSYMCKLRKQLGWTTIRVQYCQLISHINKLKRKHWCLRALHMSDSFSDVIFVDETTVELSSTGRIHYFKRESEMQYISSKRPKPKHSYKVHVWGGISYRGATDICIFSGIMDSLGYQRILDQNFLPFTATRFSNGYRLYQVKEYEFLEIPLILTILMKE